MKHKTQMQILNEIDEARKEYENVESAAWEKYKKVEVPAREEYEKVKMEAWEDFISKVKNK